VGAHNVPGWYEALDRLITLATRTRGPRRCAVSYTQAAILEQEIAGIDIISGGEMQRRTYNRHSPPNAVLNYLWQKNSGVQGITRPKPVSMHDPNVFHPAAVCRGPIGETIDFGLVEEFKIVSSFARRPVKITMTGPHLLAAVAYNEYCHDLGRMVTDLGKLLHHNFTRLAAAGRKHIQIDEPYFTWQTT
jgi:5-methyltetrahydropteroyltriglutamate--homocysteine methyltransferase